MRRSVCDMERVFYAMWASRSAALSLEQLKYFIVLRTACFSKSRIPSNTSLRAL